MGKITPWLEAGPLRRSTLAFRDHRLEARFRAERSRHWRAHDQQAASVYLAMVVSGSLLYLFVSAFVPAAKAGRVDQCGSIIACSLLGPAAHLGLLLALPDGVYERHRTAITLAFRAFYLAASTVNGFGVCGVGPITPPPPQAAAAAATDAAGPAAAAAAAAAVAQQESPLSALLWRSGVIGLVWWAGAFPLLFWQHVLVQTVFLLVYGATLAPLVCSGIQGVQGGARATAALAGAGRMLWAALLGAHGAPAAAVREAAAAAAQLRGGGPPGGCQGTCLHGLRFLQLTAGHALPTLVVYCVEARLRLAWWSSQQQQQQQQQRRRRALSGDAGSSTMSSGAGSSSGGLLRCSSSRGSLDSSVADAEPLGGAPQGGSGSWHAHGELLLSEPPPVACRSGPTEFDRSCAEAGRPPTFAEAYVLVLGVGLAWAGLTRLTA